MLHLHYAPSHMAHATAPAQAAQEAKPWTLTAALVGMGDVSETEAVGPGADVSDAVLMSWALAPGAEGPPRPRVGSIAAAVIDGVIDGMADAVADAVTWATLEPMKSPRLEQNPTSCEAAVLAN